MKRYTATALFFFLVSAAPAIGDEDRTICTETSTQQSDSESNAERKRPRSLAAMPLVDQSPTLGTAFGGMALYFFEPDKNDQVSPPSILSVVGLYSTTIETIQD